MAQGLFIHPVLSFSTVIRFVFVKVLLLSLNASYEAYASSFSSISAVVVDNEAYLVFGGKTVRRIPNNATLEKLGYEFTSAQKISLEAFSKMNRGRDIESMVARDTTTDEVHRIECLKLAALQNNDDLVKKYRRIGDFFNPYATMMDGNYVVASGLLNFHVGFTVLDTDFNPLSHSFLGIEPGKNDIMHNFHIVGADSRVMPIPGDGGNSFLLVCTGWYHPIRLRAVVLSFAEKNGSKILRAEREYRMNPFLPKQEHSDQKNWIPFIFNGTIFGNLPARFSWTSETTHSKTSTERTLLVS
jgi:hypothetical protein